MLISAVLYSMLAATKINSKRIVRVAQFRSWHSFTPLRFGNFLGASSPSSIMTREGAVKKWPSLVPTLMPWRWYASRPFLMYWCRSSPLSMWNLFCLFCLPVQQHCGCPWLKRLQTSVVHWPSLLYLATTPQFHPLGISAGSGTSWLYAMLWLILKLTFGWSCTCPGPENPQEIPEAQLSPWLSA